MQHPVLFAFVLSFSSPVPPPQPLGLVVPGSEKSRGITNGTDELHEGSLKYVHCETERRRSIFSITLALLSVCNKFSLSFRATFLI